MRKAASATCSFPPRSGAGEKGRKNRTMNQSKLDQLEAIRSKLVDRLIDETERGLRSDMKKIDEIGRLMQENCKEVFREITGRDLTGPS